MTDIPQLSIDVNDIYKDNKTNETYFIVANCDMKYLDDRWFRGVVYRDEKGNIFTMQINEFIRLYSIK